MINSNVCTKVISDPVNYDEEKYTCRMIKNNK